MRGMERHDDREIGRWRHVAFDDGDGSIQMAVDANTPDERHLDGWIGARHRFALACETADPAAMRDALDAVRDRATRDHIFEESLNASHGGAGYHTPFSESWRLLDILDLALDLFVPRDDEPLWMGLPCMGWEDGEATEGAIVDPTDLTVAADGSPSPSIPIRRTACAAWRPPVRPVCWRMMRIGSSASRTRRTACASAIWTR